MFIRKSDAETNKVTGLFYLHRLTAADGTVRRQDIYVISTLMRCGNNRFAQRVQPLTA